MNTPIYAAPLEDFVHDDDVTASSSLSDRHVLSASDVSRRMAISLHALPLHHTNTINSSDSTTIPAHSVYNPPSPIASCLVRVPRFSVLLCTRHRDKYTSRCTDLKRHCNLCRDKREQTPEKAVGRHCRGGAPRVGVYDVRQGAGVDAAVKVRGARRVHTFMGES